MYTVGVFYNIWYNDGWGLQNLRLMKVYKGLYPQAAPTALKAICKQHLPTATAARTHYK